MAVKRITVVICSLAALCCASCSSSNLPIGGTVVVDGAPLDEGIIHFRSTGDSGAKEKEVGAAVHAGEFVLPAGRGLSPGEYSVTVQGFKKTGRTIADPQRGKVEEKVELKFKNSPQKVELSKANSSQLRIELKAAA